MFTVIISFEYLSDRGLSYFHVIPGNTFLINRSYLLSLEYCLPSRRLDSFFLCNAVYNRIVSSLASNTDPRYTRDANGLSHRIVHGSHAYSNGSRFVHDEIEPVLVVGIACIQEILLAMSMRTNSRVSALESEKQLASDGSAAVEREDLMIRSSLQNW